MPLWVILAGCHTDLQVQAAPPTITPAVNIIYVEEQLTATHTFTPQEIATFTAFAPNYDLLFPGETLRRVRANVDNAFDETGFSILTLDPVLEYVDQAGPVIQSRWQTRLDVVYTHQDWYVYDVYIGDIIECQDYRIRVITIPEGRDMALVAWSRVDTPLTPLSQGQIAAAYDTLLPYYDFNETGVVLPAVTEITYNDSLSLLASQLGAEEVNDSYNTGGFHKRWRFNLAVIHADTQFERVVYTGDILEFDGYRIRVHYIDNEFVYLAISLSDNTD